MTDETGTSPRPAPSEPTGPEPTGPEPSGPEPSGPEPSGPEPSGPEPTRPEPSGPEPTRPEPSGPEPTRPEPTRIRSSRKMTALRLIVIVAATLGWGAAQTAGAGFAGLSMASVGTPGVGAHGSGHDAEWLGHAWVDGRKVQSDVDTLARSIRGTGIQDLFVHSGPFNNDGTLDPALRPKARWLIGALHTALPGVRVQAWLGAHPVPGQLRLESAATREAVLGAIGQVLDDGYAGVHLDFEPVDSGDPDLVTLLREAHAVTGARHAVLSLSASELAPVVGLARAVAALPGRYGYWSAGYLATVARCVDQVALMAYDTSLPTAAAYTAYVRLATRLALTAVPPDVDLFVGVPAYHERDRHHHPSAETMAAALRGVRLALGSGPPPGRNFGVAVYVDFTATPADWAAYREWSGHIS